MRQILRLGRNIVKYNFLKLKKPKSIHNLIARHFRNWSEENHINRPGITLAINEMLSATPVIVETGTSAYGTDSSRLFDALIRYLSGTFYSVDINPSASRDLIYQHDKQTFFFVDDSVNFLKNRLGALTSKVDLFYLDSFDVDWEYPLESARHGISEFEEIKRFIKPGTILIVDDTPSTIEYIPKKFQQIALDFQNCYGVLPGKGALILKELQKIKNAEVLLHEYNLVVKFN